MKHSFRRVLHWLLLLLMMVAALPGGAAADTFNLKSIRYEPSTQVLTLQTTGPIKAALNSVALKDCQRVLLDLKQVNLSAPEIPQWIQALQHSGLKLSGVYLKTFTAPEGDTTRLTLDLPPHTSLPTLILATGQTIALQFSSEIAMPAVSSPAISPPQAELSAEALHQQLSEAQRHLSEAFQTINQQNRQIVALQKQIADLKQGVNAATQEQLTTLNKLLEERDARIRQLEARPSPRSGLDPAFLPTVSLVPQPAVAMATLPVMPRQPVPTSERDALLIQTSALLKGEPLAARSPAMNELVPAELLTSYAGVLKKAGRADEAEAMLQAALTAMPDRSDLYYKLGNLYRTTRQFTKARDAYLKTIEIDADFRQAHYNLAKVYVKLGERPKAVEHLESFARLSPRDDPARAEALQFIEKLKRLTQESLTQGEKG